MDADLDDVLDDVLDDDFDDDSDDDLKTPLRRFGLVATGRLGIAVAVGTCALLVVA